MAKLLFPAPVGRSPTAMQGSSDYLDGHVYSAGVLAYGATGNLTLFTVPKGQAIPEIKGTTITDTAQDYQKTYTDLTTNMSQAGQLGNGIGDIAVRAIAIDVEEGYEGDSYGVDERGLKEVQRKMSFVFTIGKKEYTKGPLFLYGAAGGAIGSIGTTNTDKTVHLMKNGQGPRRLKMPIPVGRTDQLECVLTVQGSTGLSFTTSTGYGQASLIWVTLFANIQGDVR